MTTHGREPLRTSSARRAVRIEPVGEARQYQTGAQSVTFVPLAIQRRHNRKVMMPPPGEPTPASSASCDLSMIKTLGKAFHWQRMLDTGQVPNATELARRLRLEPGWVAEVLRMTLLAPDIVEAVLDGHQPRHLNLHRLRGRQLEVPLLWEEQRRLFGFSA